MKKLVSISFALLFIVALTLPVIAGGQDETGEVTFNYLVAQWMFLKLPVEASAERFMADHPNVKMVLEGYQDYSLATHLLNWSTGDADVDFSIGGTAGQVARLGAKDLLMDLSDFYSGEFAKSEFVTPLVENPQKAGEYFAVPVIMEGMMLEGNRQMMIDAGLAKNGTPINPKTLDDLYEYAKKLTKGMGDVKDVYGFCYNFSNFHDLAPFSAVHALGGKVYNSDGSANLDSREFENLFAFIKKTAEDGYMYTGTITETNSGRSGYFGETIALLFESSSRAIEGIPQLGDKAVAIPFPDQEKNGGYVFAHHVYMPRTSKHKDIALQYMREQVFTTWFAHEVPAITYGKHPVMKKLWNGLPAHHAAFEALLLNPGNIADKAWVEGGKLNQLLIDIEQALVTTDLTVADGVKQLREEGGKLDLTVVQ
jgi:ABC-type glycerol-3-phosphate transport system substrate-binding protein